MAASQLPPAFQPYASLFANMAIYRCLILIRARMTQNDVTIGGNSGLYFQGDYVPAEREVTFQGNPTIDLDGGASCGEVHCQVGRVQRECHIKQHGMLQTATKPTARCAVGAMMRKLDQRGVAALEFCLVAVPLFILMFAIFDLGRYAITMQSLRMLANAGARAIMISCYTMPQSIRRHPLAVPVTPCHPMRPSKLLPRSCIVAVSRLH